MDTEGLYKQFWLPTELSFFLHNANASQEWLIICMFPAADYT